MLQMITKYSNHLIELSISTFLSNDCESQEFCQKFGQKLKHSDCGEHVFNLNLFPNIETIYYNWEPHSEAKLLQWNSVNLKKLAIIITEHELHLLSQLMLKFDKLTHLSLILFSQ